MNISPIKNIALALSFTVAAFGAKAQKVYKEGTIAYNINVKGQDVAATAAFRGDSSYFSYQPVPVATIKIINTAKFDYFAIAVDVPVMSRKTAAVASPAELEEMSDDKVNYSITPTTEIQKIGDYNCKKYLAKEAKSGVTYDLWVTTDISTPSNLTTKPFESLGGVPIKYPYIYNGIPETITLKSISEVKVPAGAFTVGPDYTRITMDELKAMSRGKQ